LRIVAVHSTVPHPHHQHNCPSSAAGSCRFWSAGCKIIVTVTVTHKVGAFLDEETVFLAFNQQASRDI
jgi:hypothetical protein